MNKRLLTSAVTFTLVLAVSIIFLGLYVRSENIKQVNFYYNDNLVTSSTKKDNSNLSQDVKDLLNVLKTKIPYNESFEGNYPYKAQIITESETNVVYFSIDIISNIVVIFIDDNYYTLNEEDYIRLTCNPLFKEIYYSSAFDSNPLTLNGVAIDNSITYKLSYTDESGNSNDVNGYYPTDSTVINLIGLNDNLIKFDEHMQPTRTILNVFKGDEVLYSSDIVDGIVPIIDSEGELRYVVTAIWDDTSVESYTGTLSYEFYVNLDIEPSFSVAGGNSKIAGQFYVITAKYLNKDEIPLVETELIKSNPFFKIGNDYIMIIPLDYYKTKSSHKIDYYIEKDGAKTYISSEELLVEHSEFDKQYLNVDQKTTSSTRNDEAYAEYDKIFAPVREKSNSTAYFSESFQIPCDGRISTEFGMMRYVNGSLTSYRHSGLDIAAKRGTAVKASNTGKVLLSANLILTGNTVVIDHGLGIFSVYFHMDSLEVNEGDMVLKDHTVGTVGSTGFSTGPHLHFTTSYYKTNINPDFLINMPKDSLEELIKK